MSDRALNWGCIASPIRRDAWTKRHSWRTAQESERDSVEKNLCVARPSESSASGARNFAAAERVMGAHASASRALPAPSRSLAPLLLGAERIGRAPDYAADARSIERLVNEDYAYLDRLRGRRMPITDKLRAEADAGHGCAASWSAMPSARWPLLADHHAITGGSLADSWASGAELFGDLWIEPRDGAFVIERGARRLARPSGRASRAGDRLVAVDGQCRSAAAVAAVLGRPRA